MDSADENEATSGGGLQRGAEGARLRLESGMEGVRGQAGTEPAGGGEAGDGLTGTAKVGDREKGSGRTAEEMRVDLTVVKEEVMDWSEMEEGMPCGQRIKQEVEEEKPDSLEVRQEVGSGLVVKEETVDEPEVMDGTAKVKEEGTDWREVKEERKGNLEVKQMFFGQTIKKEMMDEVCVKKEKHFPKTEMLDDTKVKEGPQINSPVGSKRKLAMSRCETCGTEEAKYRCPRCMRYSCSLPCVKKHKVELTCNGVRDKTAYISLQQFTEMDLLSDYRFLEDVARTADHISRDVLLKKPLSNKHMYFMKNRARRQGINLKLLPNGFTKRKENSTFFDKKKQQFCWHVKLQFPQSQAVYIEKRVPDDKTINEILRPYIDPEKSDPVIRQRLKAYTHSQTGVQILMKVENMQQNSVRYQLNHGHLIYLISQIIKLLYPKLRKVARIILVQLLTTNGFFIFDLLQCACSEEGKDAVTDVRLGILGMGVVHMNIIRHRGDGEDQLENFCTHRYYELDPHKSLLDNLRNKVIIEYPTLHVVLKESNKDMKVLHQGVHMKVRLPVTKQKEKATFVEYLEPSEK